MTTPLIMSACIFELSLNFHAHRADGTLRALVFFYLQGAGLHIAGTATLINTNVYSNEASYVRWPSALA